MSIAVTGGAGYIGSHMVDLLRRQGLAVVVVDDLRTGHRDALAPNVPWLNADVADRRRVTDFFREHAVDVVFHFASLIQVGESMIAPRKYYVGNLRIVAAEARILGRALRMGGLRVRG